MDKFQRCRDAFVAFDPIQMLANRGTATGRKSNAAGKLHELRDAGGGGAEIAGSHDCPVAGYRPLINWSDDEKPIDSIPPD